MKRRILATAAALAACVPAAPARAATPTHVAIVVTYQGTTVARCAPVQSSGLADLQSRFTVVVGQPPSPYAGFVFTIDGHGTTHPDDTHYWAYYHRVNGAWVYSSAGAASYRPPAGAVEGWAYDNGAQTAPQPPARSYSSVCGSTAAGPTPATTTAAVVPRVTHSAPAAPRTSAARPAPARTSPPRQRSARPATVRPARPSAVRRDPASASRRTRSRPSAHRSTAAARATAAAAAAKPAASPAATPATRSMAATSTARPGNAPPWAPLTALALVAALGGGAWWRMHGKARA